MPIIACFEGRLAAEPQLERTPNGTAVVEVAVYANRRVRDDAGEWSDATATRYWVKAWKRRAEELATLGKGTSVVVIGHVETDSWEAEDGSGRRYRDTVVVDAIGASLGISSGAGGDAGS